MADEPVPDEAPSFAHFCQDDDEMRRCYIFEMLGDPQIEGRVLVENMARVERWLKTGEVDKERPPLRVAKS
jgi:hypothetical protein